MMPADCGTRSEFISIRRCEVVEGRVYGAARGLHHSQPGYSTDVLISTHCAQSLSKAPLKINGTF